MENKRSIADILDQYFLIQFANTPEQLAKVFEVRYRVYCQEFGYEDADLCPDHQEKDEYDDQSIHCLITHRATGIAAGCVRMVPTQKDDPVAPMPFEQHCGESLDRAYIHALNLDRSTTCEISRLAVDERFRRRGGEKTTRYGQPEALDFNQDEQRCLPFIAISAFLAATAITDHTGRRNVFAMMEPFLPRLLARSGIKFERAGEDMDYHGTRAAYFITTQAALEGMKPELRALYDRVQNQLYNADHHDTLTPKKQQGHS